MGPHSFRQPTIWFIWWVISDNPFRHWTIRGLCCQVIRNLQRWLNLLPWEFHLFWNKEHFYVWCFYLDCYRGIQKRFTDLIKSILTRTLKQYNNYQESARQRFIFILFLFCFPKVERVVNALYIEKSINLLISICFPVFSLETNQEMRNVLNLISGVIIDMDIISFNRCTKQTSHFFSCTFLCTKNATTGFLILLKLYF